MYRILGDCVVAPLQSMLAALPVIHVRYPKKNESGTYVTSEHGNLKFLLRFVGDLHLMAVRHR